MKAALALLTLLLVPLVMGSGTRVDAQSYVGGTGDVIPVCSGQVATAEDTVRVPYTQNRDSLGIGEVPRYPAHDPAPSVGGACFPLTGQESRVQLSAADSSGQKVAFYFEIRARDAPLASGVVCGAATTSTAIPMGATTIVAFLDEAGARLDCANALPATVGTLTASFT